MLLLLCAGPAAAQGVLPQTGTEGFGTLRQQVEGVLTTTGTGGTPAAPGWTFTPSIGLEQRWTDQVQPGVSGSTFVTVVRPGLLVSGESSRLKATLSYQPEFQISSNGSQDRIGHNLSGQALVTLVPEHAFLDLRGFAGLQSTTGGTGPSGTTSLGNRNAAQSSSFSVTPYLRERFGDLGIAELGVSLAHTAVDGFGGTVVDGFGRRIGGAANQNSDTLREYLSFTSGPAFGRFATTALASSSQSDGSGVMRNARRDVVSFDNAYAVTREVIVLAKIGYQRLRYGGIPPFRFNGPLWNLGVRWLPNPDSSIELRWGEKDGRNSAELNASYAPGPRTRIFARYSEGLSTEDEDLQNALAGAVLDPLGNPVDAQSGAPLLLAGGLYGTTNDLARVKRASLTGMLLLDRDSLSVSLSWQDRRQVASASLASIGLASTGTYGSVSWQHDFGRSLTGMAFLQYGVSDNTGTGTRSFDSLALSLALTYALSETLSGSLQYSYLDQSFRGIGFPSPPVNLVVLGLRKTF